jgi:hypothetical protein
MVSSVLETCGVVVFVFRGLRVSLLRCLSDAQDGGQHRASDWKLFRSGLVQQDQSP